MDIRDKIRLLLREQYGDFSTYLEHVYETKLTDHLAFGNKKKKEKWVTYNQVVLEVKNEIKDKLILEKLQYHLTDKVDPNIVCIDVIREVKNPTQELDRLYHKILGFI
jgi:hypothetical protein